MGELTYMHNFRTSVYIFVFAVCFNPLENTKLKLRKYSEIAPSL